MRFLFASVKMVLVVAITQILACASSLPVGDGEEEPVILEGDISVKGGHPFESRIQLSDSSSNPWVLIGGKYEAELRNLDGHGVRIWGYRSFDEGGAVSVLVSMYELLPIDGYAPVIGRLYLEDDLLMLQSRESGEHYRLNGPLSRVLEPYRGFCVWVCGSTVGDAVIGSSAEDVTDQKDRPQAALRDIGSEHYRVLRVLGYGVLGPLQDGANPPASSDTLHSSGNG